MILVYLQLLYTLILSHLLAPNDSNHLWVLQCTTTTLPLQQCHIVSLLQHQCFHLISLIAHTKHSICDPFTVHCAGNSQMTNFFSIHLRPLITVIAWVSIKPLNHHLLCHILKKKKKLHAHLPFSHHHKLKWSYHFSSLLDFQSLLHICLSLAHHF